MFLYGNDNVIYDAILFCLFAGHEIIPFGVHPYLFDVFSGMFGEDGVKQFFCLEYLPSVYLYICGLPVKPPIG